MPDDIPPPVVPLDDDPPQLSDNDIEPMRCQEPGCTNPLEYSGRGRKPKFCPEHKGSTAKSSTSARTPSWPKAATVESALQMYLGMLGAGVAFVDPFDGRCIAKGKNEVARELVNVARSHKDFRKVLEAISMPGEYAPLMAALLPVIVPIMAHHDLLPQFIIPMVVNDPELIPPTPAPTSSEGRAA